MKQKLKKHLINAFGQRVKPKVLVFESDDWGSIRIPNTEVKDELLLLNAIRENDPFSIFDCLESSVDLEVLYNVLSRHNDQWDNNPVITTNMVITNPDFEAIRKNQFTQFESELFINTYKTYYPHEDTFKTLKDGIQQNFIYPQFHAKEHLNVRKWMEKLRTGDAIFLRAFELKCFSVDDNSSINQRKNLMATYDYLSQAELDEIEKSVTDGLNLFKEVFGFSSQTSIAPCYVWNDAIEGVFHKNGIYGIQGSSIQQKNTNGVLKRTWRSMGKNNKYDQRYTIRNGLFEPSLNKKLNWVEKALESIQIAFKWGKPAVIGTHRINYVGGLSVENRENTLEQLDELLFKVLKKWPDIQFLNSAELIELYRNG